MGLKAALAAKVEIVDVPIVYMMILDPLKHQLTAGNMTGTLLEVPVDRQLKIMRTFLPTAIRNVLHLLVEHLLGIVRSATAGAAA